MNGNKAEGKKNHIFRLKGLQATKARSMAGITVGKRHGAKVKVGGEREEMEVEVSVSR